MSDNSGFPNKSQALIIALIGLAAVSHAVIFIRLADPMPALALAIIRVGLATIIFAPLAVWGLRRRPKGLPQSGTILLCCAAGIFLALHFATWIEAVQRVSIAQSALLVSLAPLWIAVAQAFMGQGWPHRDVVIGMVLCVVGMTFIGWDGVSDPSGDPFGLALALLGGLALAGYLMLGKQVRQDISTLVYVSLCYASATVCLAFAGFSVALDVSGLPLDVWIAALALGLVSQVIGHTAYNVTLNRLSPIFVAICLIGEPIIGGLLGLLYLGEAIPSATLIGGVPILIGLWLALYREIWR